MQIITISIGEGPDGAPFIQLLYSDGVNPAQGASACRSAASTFDNLAIEAEVQRRLAEREREEDDVQHEGT